jgi:hypothetical protein
LAGRNPKKTTPPDFKKGGKASALLRDYREQ